MLRDQGSTALRLQGRHRLPGHALISRDTRLWPTAARAAGRSSRRRAGGGRAGPRADPELDQDLVELVLDGARTDEQARWRSPDSRSPSRASRAISASWAVSTPRHFRSGVCGRSRRWPGARARARAANASTPIAASRSWAPRSCSRASGDACSRGAAIRRRADRRGRAPRGGRVRPSRVDRLAVVTLGGLALAQQGAGRGFGIPEHHWLGCHPRAF